MFERQAGSTVSAQPPPLIIQRISAEFMPTLDGRLSVSLAGTYLDEEELAFVNEELAGARATSLDEALAVVRNTLAATFELDAEPKGS